MRVAYKYMKILTNMAPLVGLAAYSGALQRLKTRGFAQLRK
jgi:hypothetical protein